MAEKSRGAEKGLGFAEIKPQLLARIDRLARELAPRGSKSGAYWLASDPTGRRADKNPSFWVRISGPAPGAWRDEVSGEQGDVIMLVMHCTRLANHKAVRQWCLDWLGLGSGTGKIDRRKMEARKIADTYVREQEEREARDNLQMKRRQAKGWWLHAQGAIEGSPVATYLAARGIDLRLLAAPPRALRYLAKADHVDNQGEITEWPCMIAAMCAGTGAIVAVHRTFLAVDGSAKAPVMAAKKIWPHGWKGSVIRLAKGAGQLNPEQAAKKRIAAPLVVTEGIEDGLSVALACPHLRVWAAGTLGNLAHVPVEHPCVSKVIVFADNDASPQARALFDKGIEALRAKRPVSVARAFQGKDANDLLRGKT